MSTNHYKINDDRRSAAFIKEKEKKVMAYPRNTESILLTPQDSIPQKPSARNTPMMSFQLHHTEISTDRPSVSGRLLLHIPKIPGKKFHFVSLALHLRLRESIEWSRQDLVTFETEKQSWAQTVWDKKVSLLYQDRQVEEGGENTNCVALVKEPLKNNNVIEIAADEWRWEWLMPVTEHDVFPESFEGSMGNIWYELEAKCLFRWDTVDKYGNVVVVPPVPVPVVETITDYSGDIALRKEDASKKSLSFSSALGKLRIGSKGKKEVRSGDFKLKSQHDEFIQRSIRMRTKSVTQAGGQDNNNSNSNNNNNTCGLLAASRAQSTPHLLGHGQEHGHLNEPPPFLIRKIIKPYFIKPPPNTSPGSGSAYSLPPPAMTLPTLPATRRLKAIIPGARIQVQIQIPSLIPIRGYSQTSQLVPDKKGGLVINKHIQNQNQNQNLHLHHQHLSHSGQEWSGYLNSFQVALTVRKLTPKEIEKSEASKKRFPIGDYKNSPFASTTYNTGEPKSEPISLIASQKKPIDSEHPAGSERSWRKEIRVRKVKCEFWQKESCRIPSGSKPLEAVCRSIKYPLGPVFSYSEKEQDRERSRLSMQLPHHPGQQQQLQSGPIQPMTTVVSWDASVTGGVVPTRKDSSSGLQTPSILKNSNSPQSSSPLQVPSVPVASSDRKGSNASLVASPIPRINTLSNGSKPFMLLIPVPLDSPKLRQSFLWTTAPATQQSKYTDPLSMQKPRSSTEGVDYPSSRAIYEMALMGTAANNSSVSAANIGTSSADMGQMDDITDTLESLEPNRHHHHHQPRSQRQQAAARSHIEVKHYLSLRLSIDMLEFEGELEHDEDQDLEAMEEQQLQQVRNRQELSAYRMKYAFPSETMTAATTTDAGPSSSGVGNLKANATTPLSGSDTSSANASIIGVAAAGPSSVQPALTFLNSTVGLLDMDIDLDENQTGSQRGQSSGRSQNSGRSRGGSTSGHQNQIYNSRPSRSNSASSGGGGPSTIPQPLVGALYDFDARRGSEASQGTVKSDNSSNGNSTSVGLVASAIGVIKKKASSAGLSAVMNAVTGQNDSTQQQQTPPIPPLNANAHQTHHSASQSHRRHRSNAVNVQKLKDFVIRVPITVVIQVDDLANIGTTAKTDYDESTEGNTEIVGDSVGGEGRIEEGGENGWTGTEMERVDTGLGSECKSTTTFESHGPAEMNGHDGGEQQRQQGQQEQKMTTVEAIITPANGGEDDDEESEYIEGQFIADRE
ncbi:hypothetical protein BGZ49_008419 [Haplosporangium sp. Z 27]|nr:hypothetical protein BGZ49_008419 [Haplosporangium sp. Z 27]